MDTRVRSSSSRRLNRLLAVAITSLSVLFICTTSAHATGVTTNANVIKSDGGKTFAATVTYDDGFRYGAATQFDLAVSGNDMSLLYRLNELTLETSSGNDTVIDSSRSGYNESSSLAVSFYAAGTYHLFFDALEFSDNGDGTADRGSYTLFEIEVNVPESATMLSVDTMVKQRYDASVAAAKAHLAARENSFEYQVARNDLPDYFMDTICKRLLEQLKSTSWGDASTCVSVALEGDTVMFNARYDGVTPPDPPAPAIPEASTGSGSAQNTSEADGQASQTSASTVKEPSFKKTKKYRITPLSGKKLGLIPVKKALKAGTKITLAKRSSAKAQRWLLIPDGKGTYYIKCAYKKSLVLTATGKTPKAGSTVKIKKLAKTKNQRWKIEFASSGYRIRSVANPKLVLAVSGSKTKTGSKIVLKKASSAKSRIWTIS